MYVHRGHGHVRSELTDEARRGGRIIKKIITIITIMGPQPNWRADDSDDGHPRPSYMTKITTLNCYILFSISPCIVTIL